DRVAHDAGRGEGSFEESLQSIRWLLAQGFEVSIARQSGGEEDAGQMEAAYRQLFREQGIPEQLAFTAFPDFGTPGSDDDSPEVTENCMAQYPTRESRAHFMCTYTRMLINTDNGVRVYACTLVDDDPDYDLGGSLRESLLPRIMLRHH